MKLKPDENVDGWQEPKENGNYRYRLGLKLNSNEEGRMLFICLNPSDAFYDYDSRMLHPDQTFQRCRSFSINDEKSKLDIVNLYSIRKKDKKKIFNDSYSEEIEKENYQHIKNAIKEADKIVVAWGEYFNSKIYERAKEVEEILKPHKNKVYCIRKNKDGSPTHHSRQSPKLKIEELYFNN